MGTTSLIQWPRSTQLPLHRVVAVTPDTERWRDWRAPAAWFFCVLVSWALVIVLVSGTNATLRALLG